MQLSSSQILQFNTFLFDWYAEHGRHDLPWRTNQTPYYVMISEMMLQQTQVARVIEKFEEWMGVFSTIDAVANVSQMQILQVWQGLGYNRRGLYVHKACKAIVSDFNGVVPNTRAALQTLPGIGPYTAGAICAFAFNKPEVFVETNIRRIVIHHFLQKEERVDDTLVLQIVEQLLPAEEARDWYAAMMDYGSTLPKIIKRNPNVKSKMYTKQSAFEGSLRQVRGEVLRRLLQDFVWGIDELFALAKNMKGQSDLTKKVFKEILAKMEKEGLIKVKGKEVFLVE